MINIGVVCDINWTNTKIINNKFSKLNDNLHRIHAIYGKTLDVININAYHNNLTLIRHSFTVLSHIIYNLLKICDIWLIFTNQIEYVNSSHLVIKYCKLNNIKYIIIQENLFDYYSFNILEYIHDVNINKNININKDININKIYYLDDNRQIISFYNEIKSEELQSEELQGKELDITDITEITEITEITKKFNNFGIKNKYDYNDFIFKLVITKILQCKNKHLVKNFSEKLYDDNFTKRYNLTLNVPQNIRYKIQNTYNSINEEKEQKSIKLLYDKQEIKNEKLERKTKKNINQLMYNNNRINYYKKL